jgi:hypothetical protein
VLPVALHWAVLGDPIGLRRLLSVGSEAEVLLDDDRTIGRTLIGRVALWIDAG